MNDIAGARILITGGFIGSHIADQLIAREGVREVVLLDKMLRGAGRNVEGASPPAGPAWSKATSAIARCSTASSPGWTSASTWPRSALPAARRRRGKRWRPCTS